MITIKEFMELVEYRITEGSEYYCSAYGTNAYSLDSWNGLHETGGHSFSIVFDTDTQQVFEVTACDYQNQRAYRLINPIYADADVGGNAAWDDVDWTALESVDDFIEKACAIIAGVDYDTRIQVPLNLPKEDMFKMMQMAHERDLTLNQFIEQILCNMIECNDPNFLNDDWK
jgi:hypothetical protein